MNAVLGSEVASHRIELTPEGGDPVTVRYLEAGSGSPVVFLHGIGLDAAAVAWRHALPALARDHRVLAPDFPGHGESEKPDREYTTAYFRSVLTEFLDALDIENPNLVGASMGGAVALGHHLDGGDVEKLVLVSSHGLGSDAPWRAPGYAALRVPGVGVALGATLNANPMASAAGLESMAVDPGRELLADVREAVADPAVGRALARWQRDEFRADGLKTCYRDQLSEIDVSTLLVHGTADPIFPVAWSERAAERIPAGRFVAFEGCGHWPSREDPERFERVVGEFLAE